MIDVLCDAIAEVSSLAQRHSALTLTLQSDVIAVVGINPIYLPDDELPLSSLMRMRCLALDIKPSLIWGQGTGPQLTLILPMSSVGKFGTQASPNAADPSRQELSQQKFNQQEFICH